MVANSDGAFTVSQALCSVFDLHNYLLITTMIRQVLLLLSSSYIKSFKAHRG